MKKSDKPRVKHTAIKKLTPAELKKVSGGSNDTTDCNPKDQRGGTTCLAYVILSYP
jgi:hypothetical protein